MKCIGGKAVRISSVWFLDFTKIRLEFINVRAAEVSKKTWEKLSTNSIAMAYVKHYGA
jgi:hypothetical protein